MLSTDRVLLKNLMSPDDSYLQDISADHFEGLDNIIVANTVEKRRMRGTALLMESSSCLKSKLPILQMVKQYVNASDMTAEQAEEVLRGVQKVLDTHVLAGYLIGKYATQPNELLDEYAAQLRIQFQQEETKNPEKFEYYRKNKAEAIDRSIRKLAEDQGISVEEARSHFDRIHYGTK